MHVRTGEAPKIDLERAKYAVKCLPGKVIVVVWPELEKVGSIYLADQTKNDVKPDIGTVVGHGTDELELGDKVLLKSQAGKCVLGFDTGSWWTGYEVRMYGMLGGPTFTDYGDPILAASKVSWDRAVMAKVTEVFTPLGKNVLFRLTKPDQGAIILPDAMMTPSSLVDIDSIGPKVGKDDNGIAYDSVRPGDKAWVHEGAVTFVPGTDFGMAHEDAFYCVVQ